MVLLWDPAAGRAEMCLNNLVVLGSEVVLACSAVRVVGLCRHGLRAHLAVRWYHSGESCAAPLLGAVGDGWGQ